MANERKRKAKRTMMGFPWPETYINAFQMLAERIPSGRTQGNASALARTILEQFMFSVLDFEEAKKLHLLDPWDSEEGQIPRPSILRFAINKFEERETAAKPTRNARHNGHVIAGLPS